MIVNILDKKSKMLLSKYSDNKNNTIDYLNHEDKNVTVLFFGENNKLIVHPESRLGVTTIRFDCNNGTCIIGKNSFTGFIRVGEGCNVIVRDNVSCTGKCYISTAERSSVSIGNDCMIATANEIRADDGHPIFDIETEERVNMPRSIEIGEHVWIGAQAIVLGGSKIGDGSIIGLGSIVKGTIPNNCIAVGAPARVIKKNIAWERPHLNLAKPFIKPNASSIIKSKYWNTTIETQQNQPETRISMLSRLTSKVLSLIFRK